MSLARGQLHLLLDASLGMFAFLEVEADGQRQGYDDDRLH